MPECTLIKLHSHDGCYIRIVRGELCLGNPAMVQWETQWVLYKVPAKPGKKPRGATLSAHIQSLIYTTGIDLNSKYLLVKHVARIL
jgi:hypothetical protein